MPGQNPKRPHSRLLKAPLRYSNSLFYVLNGAQLSLYNPVSEQWTQLPPAPTNRSWDIEMAGKLLHIDGKLYAVMNYFFPYESHIYEYTIANKTWVYKTAMSRTFCGITAYNGQIYVTGGANEVDPNAVHVTLNVFNLTQSYNL
jgi:hypothetical protein